MLKRTAKVKMASDGPSRLHYLYNRGMIFSLRACKIAVLCMAAAVLLGAQDWKSRASLPGVDLSGLTATQKATALKLLRDGDCSCGCGMKMAECRVKDPSCYYSQGLASVIVSSLKAGKTGAEALAAASTSKFAQGPEQDTRLLDDPVSIPTAGAPVIGPANAPLTLIEFSDFQCPYCVKAVPQLHALLKAYPTQVKLIFKEYPLEIHSQAAFAALAAEAANKQGKFWPMHDALFAHRQELSRASIFAIAKGIGVDMKRFEVDLDSPQTKQTVVRDIQDGDRAGVEGTPTLFINGQRYNGAIALDALTPVLDAQLKHPVAERKTASGRTPSPVR
jgi:protein-disulfide isomerase